MSRKLPLPRASRAKKPATGKLGDAPVGCVARCQGADHARGCATYDKLLVQARKEPTRDEPRRDPRERSSKATVEYVGGPGQTIDPRLNPGPDMIRQSKFLETTRSFVLPQSVMRALEVLKEQNFRVRKELEQDPAMCGAVKELAGFSLERLVFIAAGKVHKSKAAAMLKASAILRQETCEPLVTKTEIDASLSLANMVAAATAQNTPSMKTAEQALTLMRAEKEDDHRIAVLKGECEDA